MAGLCEGGNEPSGSLKAIFSNRRQAEGVSARRYSSESSQLHSMAFINTGNKVFIQSIQREALEAAFNLRRGDTSGVPAA
ncbi:hypothetical protein ANN_16339 [Periplaneta americana]|uniref:Uncharacterized protein n=1 Tax=Periplaneta americana TaxID=6978 RepID=A0ABQ8SIP7_PERAM|nr:hypothetical protein ANN_16339 [Periplaneta americana]